MLENQKRSKLFSFALKAQENFGKLAGIAILWSIWALTFSSYELIFIAKVLISITAFGLGIIAPLIDFNESHASNPLWTLNPIEFLQMVDGYQFFLSGTNTIFDQF